MEILKILMYTEWILKRRFELKNMKRCFEEHFDILHISRLYLVFGNSLKLDFREVIESPLLLKKRLTKQWVGFKWKIVSSVALIWSLAVDLSFVRQISSTARKIIAILDFGEVTARSDTNQNWTGPLLSSLEIAYTVNVYFVCSEVWTWRN